MFEKIIRLTNNGRLVADNGREFNLFELNLLDCHTNHTVTDNYLQRSKKY